ncbi:MAG TPA: hypothetical protein VLN08_08585, partial [Vicinamibacterales bacterium]|nr:hypothetical protein [Vicinamibacterales bacterium]
YLGVGDAVAAPAPGRKRRRRQAPAGAIPATDGKALSSEAEFWAIVNDRSRWDDLFGDRLQKIEDDIANATADWEKRNRG